MMTITWIVFIGFMLLFIFFAFFKYFKAWTIKKEPLVIQKKLRLPELEGTYFTRYIPEKQRSPQSMTMSDEKYNKNNYLYVIKLSLSVVLVFIFMMGIIVEVYSKITLESLDNRTFTFVNSEVMERGVTQNIRYNWKGKSFKNLSSLTEELLLLKQHGLVLVANSALSLEPVLNQLKRESKKEWMDFSHNNGIKTVSCMWNNLVECQQHYQGWVFVILPDFWQLSGLDYLLGLGERVLLYDVPFQVASSYTRRKFSLYGLTFEPFLEQKSSRLILLSNRELRFAVETGTILNITRRSLFYKTTSLNPQALALTANNRVGDVLMTRLYAKVIGKGKLVWMDFIPNSEEYDRDVDKHHIEGVIASLFRYLNSPKGFKKTIKISKK